MRVHEITCPHCGSGLKSKAGIPAGQTIPCPKCKKKFAVEAADEAEVVEDFDIEDEPAPRKGAKARRAADDDVTEEDEAPPRKAKKRPADDEDTEEQPRPKKKKKKRRVQDEEEEGLYTRLKSNILVRVITLVVLLGILAVAAYLLYQKKMAEQNAAAPGPSFAQVAGPRG